MTLLAMQINFKYRYEFNPYYIRLSAVIESTSLSRSTIYRLIAEGSFPSQVPIGARSVAWVNHEIEDWCIDKLSNR